MHDCSRRSSFPRILALSSAVVAVTAFGTGCAVSAKSASDSTVAAWSKDQYVTATDDRTAAMNAARVLAMPERACSKTMQVGSVSAVIHERPSVRSKALGVVMAGSAVTVTKEGDFVRIPSTADMHEYIGIEGGDITPSWVKVRSGTVEGWVPARALAEPLVYAASSESLVTGSASEGAKGFSSKMKREATAMKGAAGTPKLKGANYAAADAILERMKSPMRFDVSSDPFAPAARLAGVPDVSQKLQDVDPAMAQQAAAVVDKVNQPSDGSKAIDVGRGLLGQIGIKQADDPKVKLAAEVAKLVSDLSAPLPVTAAEERALGRECLAKIIGNSKVLPDSSPVAAYVRWVGAKVLANSTLPYSSLGMDFLVIDDKDANAMAIPGGPIVITVGMLQFLEGEDELAAILGHEITHVEERHGLRDSMDRGLPKMARLLKFCDEQSQGTFEPMVAEQLKEAGLPDMLVKEGTKQIVGLLKDAAEELFEELATGAVAAAAEGEWTKDNQGAETGADLRGLSLCCAAEYDPAALDAALERLKTLTGQYGGASYDAARADLERRALPLLPSDGGMPPAVATTKEGATQVRKVQPSKDAVARWSKMDAELKRN